MKRMAVILLLVCFLLPTFAIAESLPDRLYAPTRYQTVFSSNTGRTEITVDALVEIPDAAAVPVVAVKPHTFSTEEMMAMADVFVGSYSVPSRTVEELLAAGPQAGVNEVSWNLRSDQKLLHMVQWYNYQGMTTYCRVNGFERGQANHNLGAWPYSYTPAIAPESIRTQGLMLAQQLAPHMNLVVEGVTAGEMEKGPVYQLVFTRTVNSIPTVHTSDGCFAVDNAAAIYADRQFPYETLFIVITPEGKVKFGYVSPYQMGEMLAEDAELLSFDAIMDIAQTMLPLKMQFQEKYLTVWKQDKVRYTVNRITFGYTRVKQRNQPNEYMMIPCWDFFNADAADESLLTLNAMDGTVIDRGYGY